MQVPVNDIDESIAYTHSLYIIIGHCFNHTEAVGSQKAISMQRLTIGRDVHNTNSTVNM